MATVLRSANFQAPPPSLTNPPSKLLKNTSSSFSVSFRNKLQPRNCCLCLHNFPCKLAHNKGNFQKLVVFASSEEATQTEESQQSEIQNEDDDAETAEEVLSGDDKPNIDESPASPVVTALQLYKEALSNNDESRVAELEAFFKSIEDEKNGLERKVASIQEDLSAERDRVLRISADFDNFRKRTEKERLSLVSNAQGEIVEIFLPVLDNFERAKSQIKVETESEQKINNSYQSIYKQFTEILGSIGVVTVETVGKSFDPLLHEAIMREESTQYDDGIVIEEYRKGFKLGERLLRPSMVKVSAGPGPVKSETSEASAHGEAATQSGENAGTEDDAEGQTNG